MKNFPFEFEAGDVVYFKSDLKKTNPMTVSHCECNESDARFHYKPTEIVYLVWMNSQRKRELSNTPAKTLVKA